MCEMSRKKKNPLAGAAAVASILSSAAAVASAAKSVPKGKKKSSRKMKNFSSSSAPVAISTRTVSTRANTRQLKNGVRVENTELIEGSISGSTVWALQKTYALNPGLAATFPWLSIMAAQYQEYRFRRLEFEWVAFAPTSTQGDVILSPDYNAADQPPLTEVDAVDHVGSITDSCWKKFSCRLNPADMHALSDKKYLRPCAVAGDIKTFDVGKFYVSTNNEVGSSPIGKLFVHYDVELMTPLNGPSTFTLPVYTSQFINVGSQTFTTVTRANVLYPTSLYDPLNFYNGYSSGTFKPPAGVYRIRACMSAFEGHAETFEAVLYFRKNSAAVGPQTDLLVTSPLDGIFPICVEGIIAFNGSDTFDVSCTMTFAVGPGSSAANNTALYVSLA